MSEDLDPRPEPRRPLPQRPAPQRPAERRRDAVAAAAAARPTEPPPGSQKRARELPRWFWLLLTAWLTFVVILAVDALTGWSDAPEGCFNSVCSTGQGVAILSLIAAVVLGIAVGAAFMTLAMGAAQGTRRAARAERERHRTTS